MRAVFFDPRVPWGLQGPLGGEGLEDILSFSFFPWSAPAIQLVNQAVWLAIVITNQSHIGKGLISWEAYHHRVGELEAELAWAGARWDALYCCPHASGETCTCRKPLPGLVYQAQADFDLDLPACAVVGDAGAWDMVLAHAVGCQAVLMRTGLGESSLGDYRYLWAAIEPDYITANVLDAAKWITSKSISPKWILGGANGI